MHRNPNKAVNHVLALNRLNDTREWRKAAQRAVRAGQPTLARGLYLAKRRAELEAASKAAHEAARAKAQAALMLAQEAVNA